MKWVKRGLLVLLALVLVGSLVRAFLPKPVEVELAPVERGPFEVTVTEPGRTRVKDRYVLSAPLGGHLERITLEPGDEVKAGRTVARLTALEPQLLDPRSRVQAEARVGAARAQSRQARAELARANEALNFARSELKRYRMLAKAGVVPARTLEESETEVRTREQALASARAGVRVADEELVGARAALSRMRAEGQGVGGAGAGGDESLEIRSPVDGWVLKVMQQSEGTVAAGTPLLEVGDPRQLEVVTDVLTEDAVRLEPGARVRILQWGGDYPLEGKVLRVEPSAFTETSALGVEEQRVNVVISLEEPLERRASLGDGFRVQSRMTLWEGEDVVSVPENALFRRGEGWAVFVADEGRVRLRQVKVGQRSGLRAQILEGLEPGAQVIVHPGESVKEGVAYTPRRFE
ncbi:HlyD family efflux transporter periplasmic adaptor subunit [Archangium gephyra]|uniref:efflux RND transporter periplasmic adaptor subunit n=1 Tax=Archangium gephyra TaxID=48 RepID=UPI0035D41B15